MKKWSQEEEKWAEGRQEEQARKDAEDPAGSLMHPQGP